MPSSPKSTTQSNTSAWSHEPLLKVEDLKAYFFMDEGTVTSGRRGQL